MARAQRGQPGGRVVNGLGTAVGHGLVPFQPGVLHGILGLGPRTEDAVGQAEQEAALLFKDFLQIGSWVHRRVPVDVSGRCAEFCSTG
jgi:hypothetical protein